MAKAFKEKVTFRLNQTIYNANIVLSVSRGEYMETATVEYKVKCLVKITVQGYEKQSSNMVRPSLNRRERRAAHMKASPMQGDPRANQFGDKKISQPCLSNSWVTKGICVVEGWLIFSSFASVTESLCCLAAQPYLPI